MNHVVVRLFLIWVLLSGWWVQDAWAGCAAGTVLYFRVQHETYLLLADHSRVHQRGRGWSGFGGRCDGQPPATAAARETEEETKGYYRRKEIAAKIKSAPSVQVADFSTFFVEVEYVPVTVINNFKAQNRSAVYRERGPYAWVPISAIWQAIENKKSARAYLPGKYLPPKAHSDWLFEPFVISLQAAKSAGRLPWKH
ncbi:hypothetical protein D1AOALGA4SA_4989 [Olavius algarvensis Delta 1 endosymbiont]|nr:hypothetical protein D1AOALGA4SA_4989 [Olavius algarvensis Delta 1 endosymbiont]